MRRHDQNSKPRVPHLPRLPAVLPPQPEVRVADPGPGALPADHDQLQSALRPGGPRLQVSAAAALRSAMAPPAGAEPRSSHSPRRSAAAPPQCPGTVLTGLRSAGLGRRSVVCGPGGRWKSVFASFLYVVCRRFEFPLPRGRGGWVMVCYRSAIRMMRSVFVWLFAFLDKFLKC